MEFSICSGLSEPSTLVLVPLLALLSYVAMPFQVRERVWSVVTPHGELDSNTHRSVTRRTGWEMIKAHPWLGLGPEQIKPQFDAYVPRRYPASVASRLVRTPA